MAMFIRNVTYYSNLILFNNVFTNITTPINYVATLYQFLFRLYRSYLFRIEREEFINNYCIPLSLFYSFNRASPLRLCEFFPLNGSCNIKCSVLAFTLKAAFLKYAVIKHTSLTKLLIEFIR